MSPVDSGYNTLVIAAVAMILGERDHSAKWKVVQRMGRSGKQRPYFVTAGGVPIPVREAPDPYYLEAGWKRPPVIARKLTAEAFTHSMPTLLLRLRSFFGVNIRADVLSYLLANSDAHPTKMAQRLAYSQPSLFQVCRELAVSDLVRVRTQGRERRYWLEWERWSNFLGLDPGSRPSWPDWISYFSLLLQLWRFLSNPDLSPISDTIVATEVRRFSKQIESLAASTGMDTDLSDYTRYPGEKILPVFEGDIMRLLERV
jgi:hypothetical protein